MPKVIGSASGNNLKITIPERGEKNWDELIENSCFTPISNHSHTGNGDGAKIDTDALEDNAVTTAKIADANVTEAKLESATQTKLAQISTNTSNISTNTSNISTNTSNIATNTSNIQQNATDIANVQAGAIPDGSVTTAKLANGAVTSAKIGANAVVGSTQIVDGTISGNKLQGDPLAGGAVNLSNLADVVGTSPTAGQVLQWTQTDWDGMGGYQWAPSTISTGGSSTVYIIDSSAAKNAYGSGTIGDTIVIPSTTTDQLHFSAALDGIKIISKTTVAQSFDSLSNCELYVEDFMGIGGGNLTNTRIMCNDMLDITTTGSMSITNCDIMCETLRLSNSGTVQLQKSNVKAMTLTQNSTLYSDNNFRVFEQSNLEFGGLGADFSTQGIVNGNYGLISFRINTLNRALKVEDASAIVTIYNSGVPAEIVGSTTRTY